MQFSLVTEDRLYKISEKKSIIYENLFFRLCIPTASNAILNVAKSFKKFKNINYGYGGIRLLQLACAKLYKM